MKVVLAAFLIIIISDFVSGLIHWWIDTYGNPKWKILGKYVIEPNLLHHKDPSAILNNSWYKKVNTSIAFGILLFVFLYLVNWMNWYIASFILYCSQANLIHSLAHQKKSIGHPLVKLMQMTGIIQSYKQHSVHHSSPFDCNYCVMTNWLNPFLNKIKFWNVLETMIFLLFRISPLRVTKQRDFL